MDLSFTRFEPDAVVTPLAPELAVLLVGIAARQAATPTAMRQVRIDRDRTAAVHRFAPVHGAFDSAVAAMLAGVAAKMKPPFTDPVSAPASRAGYGR